MLPLNLSFRRLILKYIPQISVEELERYENLMALRDQIFHEKIIYKNNQLRPKTPIGNNKEDDPDQQGKNRKNEITKRERIPPDWDKLLTEISNEIADIFVDYKKEFKAVLNLWSARRQFALAQGSLLQIPTTCKDLKRYIKKGIMFHWVRIKCLKVLWKNKIKYICQNYSPLQKVVDITLKSTLEIAFIIIFAVFCPPHVLNIPDQTINENEKFDTIPLDNYVRDFDNKDNEINWQFNDNKALKVILNHKRVANIKAKNTNWKAGEKIIFTAIDPQGLSDSDTASFTITAAKDTLDQIKIK
jgi:hypothetical protein